MIPEIGGSLLLWLGGAAVVFIAMVVLLGTSGAHVKNRLAHVSTDPSSSQTTSGLLSTDSPIDRETKTRLHQEEKKQKLRERMMQAGFYATASGSLFMMFRLVLIVGSSGLGFLIGTMGKLTLVQGIGIGMVCGVAATVAPGFWLDRVKRGRQTKLRRALPDALDVLVVCLQGGLSIMASISRVANELATAHPMLAMEFKIAERQMQMGQLAGEAIRGIADRFDMEELRGMAAVIKQAERIGASVANAMEMFAETLRMKRSQRAEELAHKAAVKMLIPTVLCIFPAIFVVILGPAGVMVYNQLILGALKNV